MDQFRGLFVKLDQNKDGFISVAELHDEMRRHGILSADGKAQVTLSLPHLSVPLLFKCAPPSIFIHSFKYYSPQTC